MNVAMLSTKDFAGSGNQFCKAVQRNSDINIRLIIQKENKYRYDHDYSLEHTSKVFLQRLINKADIIHFKGDELPSKKWNGLNIPNVPIVITAGGSGFRRHSDQHNISMALHKLEDYLAVTDYRSTLTPDLNYTGFDGHYIPQVIEIGEYLFRDREEPLILHCPSNREKKGTDAFIIPAIEKLKAKGLKFRFQIIEDVSNAECMEIKKNASLYIDQVCETGFYGMSTLEAIRYGIPVVNHISQHAIDQSEGKLDNMPILNACLNVDDLADKIEFALNNLKDLSVKTYEYCKRVHSYENNELHFIYKELYDNNRSRIDKAHATVEEFEEVKKGYLKCRILNRKIGIVNDIHFFPELVAISMKNIGMVEIIK